MCIRESLILKLFLKYSKSINLFKTFKFMILKCQETMTMLKTLEIMMVQTLQPGILVVMVVIYVLPIMLQIMNFHNSWVQGVTHVTPVLILDVDDFLDLNDRFLVYLNGLEPFLLVVLENGLYIPKAITSTPENILPRPQKQWLPDERRLANQDSRLKA